MDVSLEQSEGSALSEDALDTGDDGLDTGDDLDVSIDELDTPDETDLPGPFTIRINFVSPCITRNIKRPCVMTAYSSFPVANR